jgi:hypothetical protein
MNPILLPKVLLAMFGAGAAWKSYRAYQARRRNPALHQDPITDRWWRRLVLGVGIMGADLVVMLLLHNTIGIADWLLAVLTGLLAVGVLLAFAASFMIGWRGAS